jgi:hypothetical protein
MAWGHARQFNEPLTNEVAVVIVGNEFDKAGHRFGEVKQSVTESRRNA